MPYCKNKLSSISKIPPCVQEMLRPKGVYEIASSIKKCFGETKMTTVLHLNFNELDLVIQTSVYLYGTDILFSLRKFLNVNITRFQNLENKSFLEIN